jgi:hypothetical protein
VCETQKLHPPIRPKNPTPRKSRVSSLQCARVVKNRGAQTRCSPLPITSVRHRRRPCSARAADDRRATQGERAWSCDGASKAGTLCSEAPRTDLRRPGTWPLAITYSGKFIFFKNALYRGSSRSLSNSVLYLIPLTSVSFCVYARSSHLNASSGSPRYA